LWIQTPYFVVFTDVNVTGSIRFLSASYLIEVNQII